MIIRLNDEDVQWDTQGQLTLGDLLENFVKKRFFKDEFIAGMTVNGAEITEAEMGPVRTKLVSDVASLQIRTQTFRNVSVNALESIGEYLDELATVIVSSANRFRSANEAEANTHFVNCIDGLQTFVGIIDKIKTLNGLDFEKMTYKSRPISEKEGALLTALNAIHETQTRKDWVSLADTLEFELAPQIIEWKDVLSEVISALKAP
jgi:hypothetical protein